MDRDAWKAEYEAGAKLTKEEAETMLVRLQGHYRQPVLPISRYCSALRTWQQSVSDRAYDLKEKLFPGFHEWKSGVDNDEKAYEAYKAEREAMESVPSHTYKNERERDLQTLKQYERFSEQVDSVFMQITKSSLLGRLLYGSEKLRTQKCPLHKGKWSGIESPGNECPHHCQMTGWVYED